MKILVTERAGFIGSAVVRMAVSRGHHVINLDALTYVACIDNVASVSQSPPYQFEHADILNRRALDGVLLRHNPDAILHLAAESHVDRSIDAPGTFSETNVIGTLQLLEAARVYWVNQGRPDWSRFHQVSTDEVFGSLGPTGAFTDTMPYDPRNLYSASKAGSDHLVRTGCETHQLAVLLTNCSNNYGPYHFPEKLNPEVIRNALAGALIPIYGSGKNIRDWLHVDDHADALLTVVQKGVPGRSYKIGGENEVRIIDLVQMICGLLDRKRPGNRPFGGQISFVEDRPRHHRRRTINSTRIREELEWRPSTSLSDGPERTVDWCLENETWWRALKQRGGVGSRLGTAK